MLAYTAQIFWFQWADFRILSSYGISYLGLWGTGPMLREREAICLSGLSVGWVGYWAVARVHFHTFLRTYDRLFGRI